ncbi:MAG: TatD family hydrolase [bacterium]
MKIGPIDSHAHLSHADFDQDRDEVLTRAKEKGLQAILSIGTEPQEMFKEVDIAMRYPGFIFLAMGYHPHVAKDMTDVHYERLQDFIWADQEVVAIGEIGLDFHYNHSDPVSQEGALREQLRIAARRNLPVIVHCREAYPELIKILKSEEVPPEKIMIHCFSGDADQAKKLLSWGATLSFAGPVTFPNAEGLRQIVKATPINRILAETDAPYLAPQSNRGKRNEPAYVMEVYSTIAAIKEISVEELTDRIAENFCRFFGVAMD